MSMHRSKRRPDKPSIVWLDRNVTEKIEDEFIPKTLTDLISYKKRFYSVRDFWNYIEQLSPDEKIIFIVNISFGRGFISWINDLVQISAIYVYGIDSNEKEKWMINPDKKIMNVATTARELFPEIIYNLQQKDTSANRTVIPTENDQQIQDPTENSSADANADIIFLQAFIQTLLRIKPSPSDRQDLVAISRKLFPSYKFDIEILDDFERNYNANNVIYWYTRNGIFYQILNEALRTHDIIVIYMLRLFIIDLYRELTVLQKQSIANPNKLFRTQVISKEELEKFQQAVGDRIYMNSFLSTSSKKEIAMRFIPNETSLDDKGLVSVLLEIDIDPNIIAIAQPFVDIHEKSAIPDEDEYLIMLGSVFCITNVNKTQNDIHWTIQLKLCAEGDHSLKDEFRQIVNTMQKETNLFSVGTLLYKMGKYREAKEFYCQLLKEVDSNDTLTKAQCCKGLSSIFILNGDYDSGISFLQVAISIFKRIPKTKLYLADSYRNLAGCYTLMHKNNNAEEYFKKTLSIYNKIYGGNHMEIALVYLSIGTLKTQTKHYDDALSNCLKALEFFKWQSSVDIRYIGHCYCNLGVIYCQFKQYDLALFCLEKQLKIQHKTLPVNHCEIGITYLNIGEVYEGLNFYNIALYYYEQANEIFRCAALLPEHDAVVELQQHIQSTKMKLDAKNKLVNLMMLNKYYKNSEH